MSIVCIVIGSLEVFIQPYRAISGRKFVATSSRYKLPWQCILIQKTITTNMKLSSEM